MEHIVKMVRSIIQIITIVVAIGIIGILIPIVIGIKPYVVLSGSMEPEIKTGSITYIMKTVNSVYEIGDIVMFKYEKSTDPITHRIVNKDKEASTYTTKGDGNTTNDATQIKQNQIIGKVAFTIPYIGYIIHWFQSKLGKLIILYLILINSFFCVFDKKKER